MRSFWWRRRVRKAFAGFVSDQSLQEIEDSLEKPSSEFIPQLTTESIRYVILQVRDDTPEDVQRHLARVFETIIDNDGVVEDIMSSIVTAIFKQPLRPDWTDALLGKLGSDVRAVYGDGNYPRGTFGSQGRFNYGMIYPDIGAKLGVLLRLEFGASKEI